MLRCSHRQHDLLHSDNARVLSDMPSFRLQLGSIPPRDMRGPEIPGPFHRRLQLVDGYHDRCTTIAGPMEASNADGEEDRHKCFDVHGNDVRTASQSQLLFSRTTLTTATAYVSLPSSVSK